MAKARAGSRKSPRSAASGGKPKVAATKASSKLSKGDPVQWNYAAGKAIGKVVQVFREKITRTLKGAKITRVATPEKPAALVKSDKGGEALKSASELKKAPKKKA